MARILRVSQYSCVGETRFLNERTNSNAGKDLDTNSFLKQMSNFNTTNVWVEGPLSAANLSTYNADQVGMQACWYGNYYGDSDYTHTPLSNSGLNDTATGAGAAYSSEVGMHIWFASDATTFQQYGWRDGNATWTYQQTWPKLDDHAGVGCMYILG